MVTEKKVIEYVDYRTIPWFWAQRPCIKLQNYKGSSSEGGKHLLKVKNQIIIPLYDLLPVKCATNFSPWQKIYLTASVHLLGIDTNYGHV